MLEAIGRSSLEDLLGAAVPDAIKIDPDAPSTLPPAATEAQAIAELRRIAAKNTVRTSMIGLGYSGTVTPAVIQRNVLENPSWYTAYTPYQPEISQGRLEALLNFQTMVADLTGLDTANASMLDEATAVVESMLLARRASKARTNRFVVDADALPQTLAVLAGRAAAVGIELAVADLAADGLPDGDCFGVLVQYPGASGRVADPRSVIEAAHERGALVVVAADLLAMTLLVPPGELGADVAAGTTQRFGVPMAMGGPHAGYLAVRKGLERQLPGRLVGVSVDADGAPAYRLSLQAREQHIRREKATSNICTAQVLLAVMASMYAVYHGPAGLTRIAQDVHDTARRAAASLTARGAEVLTGTFFDTIQVRVPDAAAVVQRASERGIWLRRVDGTTVAVAFDEVTAAAESTTIGHLLAVFGLEDAPFDESDPLGEVLAHPLHEGDAAVDVHLPHRLPAGLGRTSAFLTHPVFTTFHSETAMMRYLKYLADLDYALDRGMIPLGSCTMKLNAATEMAAVTWPEFAALHPFAPAEDVAGSLELIGQLEGWLAELTGYDAVSLQPNAGSQGELAGLNAIRGYHRANGDEQADRLPHPVERARHERGERGARRPQGRRGGLRRARQRRPRRPAREDRRARGCARGADDHLPVHARRVRARGARRHRCRARGRRPGLRRWREPQRPARPRAVRRLRRRRLAPEPAQDVLHPARRRRPRRRAGGGEGAPRAAPALASVRAAGRIRPRRSRRAGSAARRSRPRRSARPASCRSRGRTCG